MTFGIYLRSQNDFIHFQTWN